MTPHNYNYSTRTLLVDVLFALGFTLALPLSYAWGSKAILAFNAFMLGLTISAALRGLGRR